MPTNDGSEGLDELLAVIDQAAEDWDAQPEWMKPITCTPHVASRRVTDDQ